MPRAIICVLARMDSYRLPGKALRHVGDKALLHLIYDHVKGALGPAVPTVVCTDHDSPEIVELCRRWGMDYLCGDSGCVITRMRAAAVVYGAHLASDVIIRVGGDQPFASPDLIRGLEGLLRATGSDFVEPEPYPCHPRGTRVEAFTLALTARHFERFTGEDVSGELRRRAGDKRLSVNLGVDSEGVSVTVDTPDDLKRVRKVYNKLGCTANIADIVACSEASL